MLFFIIQKRSRNRNVLVVEAVEAPQNTRLACWLPGQLKWAEQVEDSLISVTGVSASCLARVVARIVGRLVVDLGSDNTSRKESAVQRLHGLLHRSLGRELDEDFHQDLGVLALALSLLLDDHSIHLALLFTFV